MLRVFYTRCLGGTRTYRTICKSLVKNRSGEDFAILLEFSCRISNGLSFDAELCKLMAR